ncbi:MAG: hypothetical protein AB7O68_08190 [Pirellulales bacterium]
MTQAQFSAQGAEPLGNSQRCVPVSATSDWVDVCSTPATADNGGGVVLDPLSIERWLDLGGVGSTLQVRLKYPTAGSVTTSPVVQVFGRDRNDSPQRLVDVDGVHDLTLSADAANDVQDSTYSYTEAAEVDCDGNLHALVAVQVALAGSSLTGATIQARNK